MKRIRISLFLFLYYFKISWFTFGGGWSIVAQMQKDFVDNRKEISSEELLDIVSLGRSLPGTMIGNVAYLFGYRQAGVLGGVLAVIGMITPPMIILTILTFCYNSFRSNAIIAKMLVGVRAAVVPIIMVAAQNLRKSAFPYKICYLICVIGCLLSILFNVNCALIILLGAASGVIIGRWKGVQV